MLNSEISINDVYLMRFWGTEWSIYKTHSFYCVYIWVFATKKKKYKIVCIDFFAIFDVWLYFCSFGCCVLGKIVFCNQSRIINHEYCAQVQLLGSSSQTYNKTRKLCFAIDITDWWLWISLESNASAHRL